MRPAKMTRGLMPSQSERQAGMRRIPATPLGPLHCPLEGLGPPGLGVLALACSKSVSLSPPFALHSHFLQLNPLSNNISRHTPLDVLNFNNYRRPKIK